MKTLKVLIGIVLFSFVFFLLWAHSSAEAEPPDFARILERSGLQFSQTPVVQSWRTEVSGPFSSNQVTVVEFALRDNVTCPVDGSYRKSAEGVDRLRMELRSTFVAGVPVCWKSDDYNVLHTYVVQERRLVYQLILN
jgi:hypothetical protein